MAHKNNEENLIPMNERSEEEVRELGRKGGIASGETRKEKATMKKTLEMLLNETNKKSGKTYKELSTLGLIKGAVNGKAENYRLIIELMGELQEQQNNTPEVNINIIDNSNLEKVMYEKE